MSAEVTGERLTLGKSSQRNQDDHVARYDFASEFVSNDSVVLDVACGTGYGCAYLSDKGAKDIVGIDIDPESIEYAKEHHSRLNISYLVGSASDIKYPSNHFDCIVSFETIEHLETEDRGAYLRELKRVLKPGGVIIISTPNKKITSPWSKKPLNKFHILEFTQMQLESELKNANINIKDRYGQRYVYKFFTMRLPYVLVRLIEKVLKHSFNIYDIADGPQVKKYISHKIPRYFVFICSK
ncbi:class I SAM-dependent methyltransferase [Candidatus Kaiserbacteria bacterium]|nr:class I SAM-dependent methyltransferase [Candidatus Kaiserbacteria bacterium]